MLTYDDRNLIYWHLLDKISEVNPKWKFSIISRDGATLIAYKPKDGTPIEEPDTKLEARVSVMLQNEFFNIIQVLQGICLSPNYDNFAEDHEILYIMEGKKEAINRVK